MDDIYYLVHVIPRGTRAYEVYDIKTKQPQPFYRCEDFIEKYGGNLRVGNHLLDNGQYEDFPGVYTSIIHKYNIDKMELFYSGIHDACVVILSKTLLLQRNYHINVIDGFGVVSDLFTFFPWELDKFIAAQKRAAENYELQLNEAVFHHNIDLHKYCCDIMPMEHFKRKTGEINYEWFNNFKDWKNVDKNWQIKKIKQLLNKKNKKKSIYYNLIKFINNLNNIPPSATSSPTLSTTEIENKLPSSFIRTSDIDKPAIFDYEKGNLSANMPMKHMFHKYEKQYPTISCEKGEPDMELDPNYAQSLNIDVPNIFENRPVITRELTEILKDGASIDVLKEYTTDPNNVYNIMKQDLIYVYLVSKPFHFDLSKSSIVCKGLFAALKNMYEELDKNIIEKYYELKPIIDLFYECNATTTLCPCSKDVAKKSVSKSPSRSLKKSVSKTPSRSLKKSKSKSPSRSLKKSVSNTRKRSHRRLSATALIAPKLHTISPTSITHNISPMSIKVL